MTFWTYFWLATFVWTFSVCGAVGKMLHAFKSGQWHHEWPKCAKSLATFGGFLVAGAYMFNLTYQLISYLSNDHYYYSPES